MTDILVGRIYRVNITSGVVDGAADGNVVQLSADGRRVWVCGWGDLEWVWLANGTWGYAPVSCPDSRLADNPVTGVIALASSGRFIDETGTVGSFHIQETYPWQASDVGWTPDGRALIALSWSLSGMDLGRWEGDPWLNAATRGLVNPNLDPICDPIVTAGGLNTSSVIEYRDDIVLARGTPGMTQACFGFNANPALPLPDGDHIGRIVGFDRIGRPLNGTVTFETDGSPPRITIDSPLFTGIVPYTLFGTAEDPHLAQVRVGMQVAAVSGQNWSAPVTLWIGNNTLGVGADDTLGNEAIVAATIRYWPAFRNNISGGEEHFHISTPPGWTGASNFVEENHTVGAAVFAPREGTYVYNTSAKVWTEPHAGIQETQAAAYSLAVEGAKKIEGPTFNPRYEVRNLTVDGHPAAEFWADVGGNLIGPNTTLAILVQTYVVSASWAQAYVISFHLSWMQTQYEGTEDWILESFHIEPPPPFGLASPFAIFAIGLVAAIGAGGLAVIVLQMRRRSSKPPIPPGQSKTFPARATTRSRIRNRAWQTLPAGIR